MNVPVMSTVFPAWKELEDELSSLSNPGSSANLLIFVEHCATGTCGVVGSCLVSRMPSLCEPVQVTNPPIKLASANCYQLKHTIILRLIVRHREELHKSCSIPVFGLANALHPTRHVPPTLDCSTSAPLCQLVALGL